MRSTNFKELERFRDKIEQELGEEQIQAFTSSIKRAGLKVDVMPTNWLDAFELLKDLVERSGCNKKVLYYPNKI